MRIVIDLQGAQAAGRDRGIGRYSLSLAKAIAANRGTHEVFVAINTIFPESIERIYEEFHDILPKENIRAWDSVSMTREADVGNEWRRDCAEIIRETFLSSLKPDLVLVTSLIEGYLDDAVTSIGLVRGEFKTAVVLYDLIPYIDQGKYLSDPLYKNFYLRKIDFLKRADLLLSISQFSTKEAVFQLSFEPSRVVNISAAADAIFGKLKIGKIKSNDLLEKLGITKPFVFSSGAADERKNFTRLIRAYASLDIKIRRDYQFVLAGPMSIDQQNDLREKALNEGLRDSEIVTTGFLNDPELVALYNLCKAFVFPSLYEGFGLPVLEAILCGAPVICSKVSSLPEILDFEEALFDPLSEKDIADKICRVLTDTLFRNRLIAHCSESAKKFTWEKCATKTIAAMKSLVDLRPESQNGLAAQVIIAPRIRPKLAFVSPLPPERTGIADYSRDLIPELAQYYNIDVIVEQKKISDSWIVRNCGIHNADWFMRNSDRFDRVVYQVGNSSLHMHMFNLIEHIPGVIVLHDFSLNDVLEYMDNTGFAKGIFGEAQYRSHGYPAILAYADRKIYGNLAEDYPCNFSIVQSAVGVLVHSDYALGLGKKWYGELYTENWQTIPLIRKIKNTYKFREARKKLGLDEECFLVCSFGMLGETKLNHRLLNAWLNSGLFGEKSCSLVFVGESADQIYYETLVQTIQNLGAQERIKTTGWVNSEMYETYLSAANATVQLRSHSRGETSAAVYDSMCHGTPTIINSHGSMAEIPDMLVFKISDNFTDSELIRQLESVWINREASARTGEKGLEYVSHALSPSICAKRYYELIEDFYRKRQNQRSDLIKRIAKLKGSTEQTDASLGALATAIARNYAASRPQKQLFVDISEIVVSDSKTGIQRVTRSILKQLLTCPPPGYRVEPVYAISGENGYRYAKSFTTIFLDPQRVPLFDEAIEIQRGDIFLGLDLNQPMTIAQTPFLQRIQAHGVKILFVVYDILPVTLPDRFPFGMNKLHEGWLRTISQFGGAICISKSIADELSAWIHENVPNRNKKFEIKWFHLGADLGNSVPTKGIPIDAKTVLSRISSRPTFLMVGTIEPRKGYLQTLKAFEQIWCYGLNVNLVIVGKEGWKQLPERDRRTIPQILESIRNSEELGNRLFWLDGISDEYLESIYMASTCLIAASEGEGFGLPLIEAAKHNLPIIARDIPVFREVAGRHATYFPNVDTPEPLVECIKTWIECFNSGEFERRGNINVLTWEESARKLVQNILDH